MGGAVEAVQIAEHEPESESKFFQVFRDVAEHGGADSDVGGVVGLRDPEPESVNAERRDPALLVAVENLRGGNCVAEGFRHFVAFFIECETVGDDIVIWECREGNFGR